jgi:hypothetical protein
MSEYGDDLLPPEGEEPRDYGEEIERDPHGQAAPDLEQFEDLGPLSEEEAAKLADELKASKARVQRGVREDGLDLVNQPGLPDFALERRKVPAHPGQRAWERIGDETGFVPLPLSSQAKAAWAKTAAAWPEALGQYRYLLKKGHIGALTHFYSDQVPDVFYGTLVEHGFTAERAREETERRRVLFDPEGDLPLDILAVWGGSEESKATARSLIREWGLDGFRSSALHTQALSEQRMRQNKQLTQQAFVKAQERKKR